MQRFQSIVLTSLVCLTNTTGCCGSATDRDSPAPPRSSQKQAAPPTDVSAEFHFATFFESRLDECIDTNVVARLPVSATPDEIAKMQTSVEAHVSEIRALAESATPNLDSVFLPRRCHDQFRDRAILATCTISKRHTAPAAKIVVSIRSTYHNFGTLETDEYMRDCLQHDGQWVALDRDSHEWRRARMRYNLEKAQRALDRASR